MDDLKMSTKADNLIILRDHAYKSYIEDLVIITVGQYRQSKLQTYHVVHEFFHGDSIVVRSSFSGSKKESTDIKCMSVLGVDCNNMDEVCSAITAVYESYIDGDITDDALEQIKDEQILIQRYTKNIVMSGVVFTRDIIYNRPYYMINYEINSGETQELGGERSRTRWIAKNVSREFVDERFTKLLTAVREIEEIYNTYEALDIGFAIDKNERIVIFRVRQLSSLDGRGHSMSDKEFVDTKSFAKCSYLDTNHVLSDKAFWNPKEAIGNNPRPLDYSLYREILTSGIWNIPLKKLGYEEVPDELMYKIGNKPYISVNNCAIGLTPRGLNQMLRYKLNDYYEKSLMEDKSLHDRVELDLIFNYYDFETDERLKLLLQEGFDENDISTLKEKLFGLTCDAIKNFSRYNREDKEKIKTLTGIRHAIRDMSPLKETNVMKLYKYIGELVEAVTNYGTPQYALQSRYVIMAKQLLKSLVTKGYFSEEYMKEFTDSIYTVATEFENDLYRMSCGELPREEFDRMYGHLRLGTYDIRTECYRDMNFDMEDVTFNRRENCEKTLDEDILARALSDIGFDISAKDFNSFVSESIRDSEYFKYEIHKTISLILDLIAAIGENIGIAREDMSYLEISELMSYHSRDSYLQVIHDRRKMYHANTYLVLPEVIYGVGDIDVIEVDENNPCFITHKNTVAEKVNLDTEIDRDLSGKIVLLTKADSEHEWIFKKNIAGLITKYGETSSQTSILCAQYNIPAAIGCGEQLYQKVLTMKKIELNCKDCQINDAEKVF